VRSKDWWAARAELQERLKQVVDGADGFAKPAPV